MGSTEGDQELIRRVLARDRAAVERFLERMRCVPRMLASKNRQMQKPLNPEEIEDLVQDTLIAVWRRLPQYDGRARLETWVYRFCVLELFHRIRREERFPALFDDDSQDEAFEAPDAPLGVSLDYERVLRSLERLEPDVADAIRLKQLEELTFEEVGERLGISANTAKTRYYRGLSKLRSWFGSQTEDRAEAGR